NVCGEIGLEEVSESISLSGWIDNRRDLGGLTFVDLRDHSGVIQLLFSPERERLKAEAQELNREDVVTVSGKVVKRDPENVNPDLATGEIELEVTDLEILNTSEIPPYFPNSKTHDSKEVTRLKYRYLDLRGERMQANIRLRNEVFHGIRNFYQNHGFTDIETPILTKSTPEGARDFLVPSRIHRGKFYALPQSPQLFKQLLMIGGFDRYFQIAKCFRDEDLRADRQPEFTQLDVEMAFVEEEDVTSITERMLRKVFQETAGIVLPKFPRLTYEEAMDCYGTDRPDLRFDLHLVDVSEILAQSSFKIFSGTVAEGGLVKGLRIPKGADYSRSSLDSLEERAVELGAQGLIWGSIIEGDIQGSFSEYLSEKEKEGLIKELEARNGDLILLVADQKETANQVLGSLRKLVAEKEDLVPGDKWSPCWIVDFPLFGKEEEEIASEHHPFTAPKDSDAASLLDAPLEATAKAYDVVLNGVELGGGSIRIHQRELQQKVFEVLGISPEEAESKFGFFLKALNYGAPPHGGIALGLDRMIMLMAGENNIRDVIPFPKTGMGQSPLTGAPIEVSKEQLSELGISIKD
ncbi:MAG: aspartate--tRNA ligase, partial [Candidatus Bipolaricaulota bacterium]